MDHIVQRNTDRRPSQTLLHCISKGLPRPKKRDSGSSSSSPSSDRNRRRSANRHTARRRRDDDSQCRKRKDGRKRDDSDSHRRRQPSRRQRSPSSDISWSRSRNRTPARLCELKPEKFSGQGSVKTFLMQFENCSAYNRWFASDKPAHLRWSLSGSAAQLLWGNEKISYKELTKKLRDRYG